MRRIDEFTEEDFMDVESESYDMDMDDRDVPLSRREKREYQRRMQARRKRLRREEEARSGVKLERKSGRGRKKVAINDIFMRLLILIFAIVFLVSAFELFSIYNGYRQGTNTYNSLLENTLWITETSDTGDGEETAEPGYESYYVDFDALSEINSDIVAWIRFDGPEIIDYPVVQTNDNSTYLTTSFTGEYNSVGTLFIDTNNSADFSDDNTIIYGHNMKNGSMFGDLSEYIDESFYLEYPYFYVYTPDGTASKYQVAIVCEVDETDTYRYTKNFSTAIDFGEYIMEIYTSSFYVTGTTMSSNDNIITLSTCTAADDERFIVQAVKIEEKDMIIPE